MGAKSVGGGPAEFNNMHQIEQDVFFAAIRAGKAINNGDYMCQSTLIGILGRTASYTGQEVTWSRSNSRRKI